MTTLALSSHSRVAEDLQGEHVALEGQATPRAKTTFTSVVGQAHVGCCTQIPQGVTAQRKHPTRTFGNMPIPNHDVAKLKSGLDLQAA